MSAIGLSFLSSFMLPSASEPIGDAVLILLVDCLNDTGPLKSRRTLRACLYALFALGRASVMTNELHRWEELGALEHLFALTMDGTQSEEDMEMVAEAIANLSAVKPPPDDLPSNPQTMEVDRHPSGVILSSLWDRIQSTLRLASFTTAAFVTTRLLNTWSGE